MSYIVKSIECGKVHYLKDEGVDIWTDSQKRARKFDKRHEAYKSADNIGDCVVAKLKPRPKPQLRYKLIRTKSPAGSHWLAGEVKMGSLTLAEAIFGLKSHLQYWSKEGYDYDVEVDE